MLDIVIPNKNEKEFLQMAQKLGYSGLCFIYDKPTAIEYNAVLIDKKRFAKADLNIAYANDDTRYLIEKVKPDIIFSAENSTRSDFIHQRNSGLNHILCKIAVEKNVSFGFSFVSLLGKDRVRLMGRVSQNIKLCRKFGVRTVLASLAQDPFQMRSPHDLSCVFQTLGMHPKETADSMNSILKLIELKRKSPNMERNGVELV